MIILPSQVSSIALDTLHLGLNAPFIQTPFIELETIHLTYTPIQSPALGLIYLEKLTLTLTSLAIPASTTIVSFLDVAHLAYTGKTLGFIQETGCELTNIIATLRQGGTARTTPARFVDCDAMDIIDAIRAGVAKPTIPYDSTDMLSSLLNALDLGNPIPFVVPTIGTWCGTDPEYPDVPPVVDNAMFRFLGSMPNETLQISSDFGATWSTHPKPKMDATHAPGGQNPYAVTYIGNGNILFSDGGAAGILYRGINYGMTWQRINISSIMPKIIRKIWTDKNGIVFANDGDTSWSGTSPTYLLKSTNYGASWTVVTLTGFVHIAMLVIIDSNTLLRTSSSKIYKSTDGGATWSLKYDDSAYGNYNSVLIYLENGIVLYINNGWYSYEVKNRIVMSTDYGETWSVISTPIYGYNTQAIYLGSGIVITNKSVVGNVYRSTDYGLTWTETQLSSYNAPVTLFNCGNGVIVAKVLGGYGTSGYYKSVDYGETWVSLTTNFFDNQYSQQDIFLE